MNKLLSVSMLVIILLCGHASAETTMWIHTAEGESVPFVISDIELIDFDLDSVLSIDDMHKLNSVISSFKLLSNHPNPFNPATIITYELTEAGHAEITIYDVMGKMIRTLVSEAQVAGIHQIQWGGENDSTFANGFWLGKYEVTQLQWVAVMGANPAHDCGVGDEYPVYNVNWDDIQAFEDEVNNSFRLPSEAEWEYACRAGAETSYFWGDGYEDIDEYAWYSGNTDGTTSITGRKLPNAWGLYDMTGNVFEWCEDLWHDDYQGAPEDGSAWVIDQDTPIRVYHGGCWNGHPWYCRSAFRGRFDHTLRLNYLGFRLVRDAE